MKRLIGICICLLITVYSFAQNQVINGQFNLIKGYFFDYMFGEGVAYAYDEIIDIKITGVTYNHPYFSITYQSSFNNGSFTTGYTPGKYSIKFDLTKTEFKSHPTLGSTKNYVIRFSSSDGIVISTPKGKTLDDSYALETSKLVSSKLVDAFYALKKSVVASNFTGGLGASSPSSSGTISQIGSQSTTYSYFRNAGFAINKKYALQRNTDYIDSYNRLASANQRIVDAYICTLNADKGDPKQVSIININIIEIPNPAQSLSDYRKALSDAGINYISKNWNGLVGVEYTMKQDLGEFMLPTKAFWGYKGNRFFLIQLGALTNAYSKYESLLNSIKIL